MASDISNIYSETLSPHDAKKLCIKDPASMPTTQNIMKQSGSIKDHQTSCKASYWSELSAILKE